MPEVVFTRGVILDTRHLEYLHYYTWALRTLLYDGCYWCRVDITGGHWCVEDRHWCRVDITGGYWHIED